MNFQLFLVGVVAFLYYCQDTEQLESTTTGTETKARIMKAFLMQCNENLKGHNNIQVTVQIAAVKSLIVN